MMETLKQYCGENRYSCEGCRWSGRNFDKKSKYEYCFKLKQRLYIVPLCAFEILRRKSEEE